MERLPFPTAIDSSMRKQGVACLRACYYNYFRHLKPRGGSIHLHFGGALAKGLEHFRKAYYGAGATFDEAIAAGVKEIILFWGDMIPPPKSNKTLENCIICLYDYFIQYPPDSDSVQPLMIDGQPAVEFTFALPIPETAHPETGDPILYTGRFDMLASYQKAIFVDDEKTATSLGASWSTSYRLASQLTGYVWACKQFGYSVQGAVVRGISPLTNHTGFQMLIEQRPQWMIDRWLVQIRRDIDRLIEAWRSGYFDYDLDAACGSYGGCPYLELCSSPQPEKWIATEFEVKPWDPLSSLE